MKTSIASQLAAKNPELVRAIEFKLALAQRNSR